jgi:7,8-dihydropterin-6-yl-methyl-4-(beta-D-ribofuranosyl)aminobenzene 5'-phosphate synthase
MNKYATLLTGVLLSCFVALGQNQSNILSEDEIAGLNHMLATDEQFAQIIKYFGDPVTLYENYKLDLFRSDSVWQEDQKRLSVIQDLGATEKFEMIPLIDGISEDTGLIAEAGVSYLIRTDNANILFDVGLNAPDSDPSPLLRNMKKLGIQMGDIDLIVISHNHGDHVGGNKWSTQQTFSVTSHQIDLGNKTIYTPVQMTYPGQEPIYSYDPVKIAEGVATIGVIHCPMFVSHVEEQAIAINVKDKGIVVISGCGHQTINKLVERSEKIFNEPLYALIGGFHLPVTESRHITKMYSWMVTGKLPWDSLSKEDVELSVALLREHGVTIVGISGHDSCDWSIQAFKDGFGKNYRDLYVGEPIYLGVLASN